MNKRIFLYTFLVFISANSLFAVTNEWVAGGTAGDWEDPANWDEGRVPQAGDDVLIDGSYTVTLESSPTIESLTLRAGADLIIASTFTLNVEDNSGSTDGVDLAGTGTTLTIHGTLNSSGHTGSGADGIEINSGSSLTLSVSGSIYISNVDGYGIDINNDALAVTVSGNITINDVGKAGIALNADFINSGTISITNPGTNEDGISTNGNDGEVPDRTFTNSGTITVVGGVNGMDISTAWTLTNTGTIILSGASVALVDSGSDIDNFGTFKQCFC